MKTIKEFKTLQELHDFEKKNYKTLYINNMWYVKEYEVWFVEFAEFDKQSNEVKND